MANIDVATGVEIRIRDHLKWVKYDIQRGCFQNLRSRLAY